MADFGKVYAGIPSVTFNHGIRGHLVTMHAGYLLDPSGDVSTTMGTQHTNMSYSYIERGGGQETFRPFDYLGFRYLQIDDPGEALAAKDIVMLTRHDAVPDENAGTFTSSDKTLDAVFDLGRHSALFTMQEQFVDTPTREKGPWLGDGANESQTAMDAFGETNLTRKDLLEFAQSQARYWPNGAINKIYPTALGAQEIPQGTAYYPEWVWQYWIHTGDRALLTMVYPVVVKVSDFFWRNIGSNGLVGRSPVPPTSLSSQPTRNSTCSRSTCSTGSPKWASPSAAPLPKWRNNISAPTTLRPRSTPTSCSPPGTTPTDWTPTADQYLRTTTCARARVPSHPRSTTRSPCCSGSSHRPT